MYLYIYISIYIYILGGCAITLRLRRTKKRVLLASVASACLTPTEQSNKCFGQPLRANPPNPTNPSPQPRHHLHYIDPPKIQDRNGFRYPFHRDSLIRLLPRSRYSLNFQLRSQDAHSALAKFCAGTACAPKGDKPIQA